MAIQIPLEHVLATQGTLPPAGVTLSQVDPGAMLPRRKWTFYIGENKKKFRSFHGELVSHILTKAFLWGLYMPQYDDILVEFKVKENFQPDLVQLGKNKKDDPVFWGEAGYVRFNKLEAILDIYPDTHFACGKWGGDLHSFINVIWDAWPEEPRNAPVDLIIFPEDSAQRFITEEGHIEISHDDVEWIRMYDSA